MEKTDSEILQDVTFEAVKSLLKRHDFYYEFSDDHRAWLNGVGEKKNILELMRRLPMYQVRELIELIPFELRTNWFFELQKVGKDVQKIE